MSGHNIPMISLELTGGGYFTGTPDQCLCFLADHRYMVKHQYIIDRYFHWSETKCEYMYIPDMHPNYIQNVLLKELRTMRDIRHLHTMESILSDVTLPAELVGEMYRIWCEMFHVEWTDKKDSLLAVLESSSIPEEDLQEEVGVAPLLL